MTRKCGLVSSRLVTDAPLALGIPKHANLVHVCFEVTGLNESLGQHKESEWHLSPQLHAGMLLTKAASQPTDNEREREREKSVHLWVH